jgi:hypothetical protein
LWDVVDDRTSFRYEINRNHPAVVALEGSMGSDDSALLGTLITMLEQSFPVEDVYNRLGQDAIHVPNAADDAELSTLAASLWESLSGTLGSELFVDSMLNAEPFNSHPRARGILENAIKN